MEAAMNSKPGDFMSMFRAEDGLILGLAPMAGTSTPPFRGLVSELSATFTISELVSARGIVYNPHMEKVSRYLFPDPRERLYAIQLFGHDPADFSTAIEILLAHPVYSQTDWIDINMGCPVKKVCGTGAGAALMLKPDLACAIAAAAVEAAAKFNKLVTVKMRSGWDAREINAPSLAGRLESEGVAGITVHARSRDQFYSGKADWEIFAAVREECSLPLCGNGDIKTAADIRRLQELVRLDAYQIGRAAMGNPFVFEQIREGMKSEGLPPEISSERWLKAVLNHLDGMIELLGEEAACREMRSQFAYYVRGVRNAADFRDRLMQTEDRQSAVDILLEVAERRG